MKIAAKDSYIHTFDLKYIIITYLNIPGKNYNFQVKHESINE